MLLDFFIPNLFSRALNYVNTTKNLQTVFRRAFKTRLDFFRWKIIVNLKGLPSGLPLVLSIIELLKKFVIFSCFQLELYFMMWNIWKKKISIRFQKTVVA